MRWRLEADQISAALTVPVCATGAPVGAVQEGMTGAGVLPHVPVQPAKASVMTSTVHPRHHFRSRMP